MHNPGNAFPPAAWKKRAWADVRPCYWEHSRILSHENTKTIIVEFSVAQECGMSAQQGDICHSPHPTSILSQVLRIVRSFTSEHKRLVAGQFEISAVEALGFSPAKRWCR